jgi:hypothetical protein
MRSVVRARSPAVAAQAYAPRTSSDEREGHVRSAVVMLACVLGAVVIAGCGGGGGGDGTLSKEDYEEQMKAIQADLQQSGTEIQGALSNPQDRSAMTAGLNEAADIFDQVSASLAEIEPPEDVAEPHQVMVDKTAAAANKIKETADAIEGATLAEVSEKLVEFQNFNEFTELQQAVTDIQQAGYDIGGSGSS